MSPNVTKFFYLILWPILGRKIFQFFFEMLYLFSLAGMNYGLPTPSQSGEAYVLKYIRSRLINKSRVIIFDVGANQGEYVDNILKVMDNNTTIYAIEPLTAAYRILRKKFTKNKKIKIFNVGFSNKRGKSNIYFDEDTSVLASLYKREVKNMSLPVILDKKETVTLSTIDFFCSRKNVSHIDLLKIDTEGHELKVLQGAKKLLQGNKISYIQFEFGGTMIDSGTFFRDIYLLLNPNYAIYRILQDGLIEIEKYSEKQEIFIMANFLAINRKFLQ